MHLRKLAGLFVLALCVCLEREARAECTTDVECKGDRICVEGACVDPPVKERASQAAAPVPAETSPSSGAQLTTAPPPSPPPRLERRSQGLFVAGIVSLALIPVGGFISFVGWGSKRSCEFDADAAADQAAFARRPPPPPANCAKHDGAIYGGLVASTVLLGGGLAMLLVGAQKVPVERTEGVRVRPWLSPTTAGLGLSTSF